MHAFQAASALCAIDLGGTYAVAYSALIEQIQASSAVIREEMDAAIGVFRNMRKHHPVEFPMLDFDMGLSSGEVVSPVTLRIFPSQQEQLIARNIRQFMSPDSSRDQALEYVQEFLERGGRDLKPPSVDVAAENATETFYSFWQDSFDEAPTTASSTTTQMPAAPSGLSPSSGVFTNTRATELDEQNKFEIAPLDCLLHVKSADATTESMEVHALEVFTESNVFKRGLVGDVSYMVDANESMWSSCGEDPM